MQTIFVFKASLDFNDVGCFVDNFRSPTFNQFAIGGQDKNMC